MTHFAFATSDQDVGRQVLKNGEIYPFVVVVVVIVCRFQCRTYASSQTINQLCAAPDTPDILFNQPPPTNCLHLRSAGNAVLAVY